MKDKLILTLLLAAAMQQFSSSNAMQSMMPTRKKEVSIRSIRSRLKSAGSHLKSLVAEKEVPTVSTVLKVIALVIIAAIVAIFSIASACFVLGSAVVYACFCKVVEVLRVPIELVAKVLEAFGLPASFSYAASCSILILLATVFLCGVYIYMRAEGEKEEERVSMKKWVRGYLEDKAEVRKPLAEQKKNARDYCVLSLGVFATLCLLGYALQPDDASTHQNVPPSPFYIDDNGEISRRASVEELRAEFDSMNGLLNGDNPLSPHNQQRINKSDIELQSETESLQREISALEKEDTANAGRNNAPVILLKSRTSVADIGLQLDEELELDEFKDEPNAHAELPVEFSGASLNEAPQEEDTAPIVSNIKRKKKVKKQVKKPVPSSGNNDNQESGLLTEEQITRYNEVAQQVQAGVAPFLYCVKKGWLDVLKYFVEHKGVVINLQHGEGKSALHLACSFGHKEIVKYLFSKGADVDLQNNTGVTALHLACGFGHKEIVKYLLSKGADVDMQNNACVTALHFACSYGHKEIFKYLFNKGADVNQQNIYGVTALHLACEYGHKELAKYMVEQGADVDLRNNRGKTPLDIAKEKGFDLTL